jgi:serine/threonine-protein kinase
MAEVYLGRIAGADRFRKVVAIKLVLPHLADDERFVEMFRREAKLSAKLDHPNIAQVLDLGYTDGEYFIAIEYVHGKTVAAILRAANERRSLPLATGLTTVSSACAGLHYAHECDLIHRDVSPANVMVRYDGTVKVLDFGIAKAATVTHATRTGTLKGKIGYMSPEQCKGAELDRRSDVFALGILLYECTTGRRLFYGDNEFAVMNKIVDADFEPPGAVREDYPPEVEAVVMRALQRAPEDRYPTAAALQEAIEEAAAAIGERLSTLALAEHMRELFGEPGYPSPDVPDGTGPEPIENELDTSELAISSSRRRGSWIVAGVVGVVALAGGAAFIAQSSAEGAADMSAAEAEPEPDPERDPVPEPEPDPVPAPEPNVERDPPVEVAPSPEASPPSEAHDAEPMRGRTAKKRKPRRKNARARKREKKKSDRNTFFPEGV